MLLKDLTSWRNAEVEGAIEGEETVEYQDEFCYQWVSTEYTTNAACTAVPFRDNGGNHGYVNTKSSAAVVVFEDAAYTTELYSSHYALTWHGEPGAGTYSVRSGQLDYNENQCPDWGFDKIGSKLVSVATPLLHCESSDWCKDWYGSNFYGCSSLISLCNKLFIHNPQIARLENCFYGCSSLTSLPEYLFSGLNCVTNFRSCFCNCTSLAQLPDALFKDCPLASNFNACFQNCNLSSLPGSLFEKNVKASDFGFVFYNNGRLSKIPDGLFSNNAQALSFANSFGKCSMLSYVPGDLFSSCKEALNFEGVFHSCSRIASVNPLPGELFKSNTKAATFQAALYGCNLDENKLSAGIFENCIAQPTSKRLSSETISQKYPEAFSPPI